MALSNTATPYYYGQFREKVIRGEIPVCEEISQEMNRIDALIADPNMYFDDSAIDGYVKYCEAELTTTDGADLHLLDTFKLWAEQLWGWYYFTERTVFVSNPDGPGGHYERRRKKVRLTKKQYIIVARGGAKSMYASTWQAYWLNVDTSTTHQIVTAPTMRQADEVLSPIRTAVTRARGPLFKMLTHGSNKNTSGDPAQRQKLAPTKMGVQNFLTNSLIEIRPMSIDRLQSLRSKYNTVDEWLSGDVRENVIGALEQGASKHEEYSIIAISSEGTVRNGAGDAQKLELAKILRGEMTAACGSRRSPTSASLFRMMPISETLSVQNRSRPPETISWPSDSVSPSRDSRTSSHTRRSSRIRRRTSGRCRAQWARICPGAMTSVRSRSFSHCTVAASALKHAHT